MTAVSTGPSLDTLTAGDFRPHHGTQFRLTGGSFDDGGPVSLDAELVEITEHSGASGSFRVPFTVLFHGPLRPVMAQGICRVEHEELGTLELFIVPVGPDEPADPGQASTAMRYEAVFG
jgi:hypothetical protein